MTRFGYVMTTYFASFSIVALSFVTVTPRLLWNASASVPVGLYALCPIGEPDVGDLVAVAPPAPLARFLAERHYLPLDTPLMKRVAALPGQDVCRVRRTITVDGIELGAALDRDRTGRELPIRCRPASDPVALRLQQRCAISRRSCRRRAVCSSLGRKREGHGEHGAAVGLAVLFSVQRVRMVSG